MKIRSFVSMIAIVGFMGMITAGCAMTEAQKMGAKIIDTEE